MTFTLQLTTQDLDVIGKALGELPYKMVGPLIAKVDAQLVEQQKLQHNGGSQMLTAKQKEAGFKAAYSKTVALVQKDAGMFKNVAMQELTEHQQDLHDILNAYVAAAEGSPP